MVDAPLRIRALGIDGGTLECGYGLVLIEGPRASFLECGTVATSFPALRELITALAPDVVGVEDVVFMRQQADLLGTQNASSMARCAAMSLDVLHYVVVSNVWRNNLGIKMSKRNDKRTTDLKIHEMLRQRLANFPARGKTNNHQRDGTGVALWSGLKLQGERLRTK